VFSYFDLQQAAARVAGELTRGRGDLDEQRVAFLVPPSFAYVVVSRGIWLAGGVAVPLAVSHPPAELEHVIRDAAPSIVVGSGRHADAIEAIASAIGARFVRTPDLIATDAGPRPAIEPSPDRRAMMVYTSGTTDRPKGVVTTHGNMAAQIASLVAAWEWTPEDCALLVLPLHHVHGIVNVLGCSLAVGASCEILPQFDAAAAWDRLSSGAITVFSAVPTIYHRLIQSWDAASPRQQRARAEGCRGVRLMMSGSAALPVGTLERWRAITGHTLLERYGMTELGMVLSNPLHGERRPGFVGTPLPGVDVRLVEGEIEVRGPGVFLEYWRRPDATREAFRNGWFRTGDVATIEDGAYRLLGRSGVDIIKSGGYRVSALEIEDAIRAHRVVVDCAVVGVPDAEWGERVCAAVELAPGAALSLEELREWTRERLAPYKLPRSLCSVAALPRNAMGKVIKTEVRRLLL
jgi:malonyl-CoA/methylmalonyl-CoA synthetase